MKNISRVLLSVYFLIFLITTVLFVPVENADSSEVLYVNLFTTNQQINLKKYFLIQILIFVLIIFINKFLEFAKIHWNKNSRYYRNAIWKLSLIFGLILLCYFSLDYFIVQPNKRREILKARIEKNKKDSLNNLKLEQERKKAEEFRILTTTLECTEENAKILLRKWVNFYHKDSKIISKIDIFKIGDCSFKASFRIKAVEYYDMNQGVVCRVTLDPLKPGSGSVYVEDGYFY